MSWFKPKAEPSRPPEVVETSRIEFIGEHAGPVEYDLKTKLRPLLARRPDVQRAYLARLSYGERTRGFSVALCILSLAGIDDALQKRVGEIFAGIFRAEEHLDILFMREDQEAELLKVCCAFYEKGQPDP